MKIVTCPVCGYRCSKTAEKCPECGFKIKDYFTDSRKKELNPAVLLIALCFFVFLAAAVFISFFYFSGSHKVQNYASESAAPPQFVFPDEASEDQNDLSEENPLKSPTVSAASIDVTGVYTGDDTTILVIDSDGYAYYFYSNAEFIELRRPWYEDENTVYIELAKLHCTIYAEKNSTELIFRSDSLNWNTEQFTRLNVSPDDFLTRTATAFDPKAVFNEDGTMTCTIDDTEYIIPDTFRDNVDESDSRNDYSCFIDTDRDTNYGAAILLYTESNASVINSENFAVYADLFLKRFMSNSVLKSTETTSIAGHQGFIGQFDSAIPNSNFNYLSDYLFSGYIAIFYNDKSGSLDYAMFMQNSHRNRDNSVPFLNMLKNASEKEGTADK